MIDIKDLITLSDGNEYCVVSKTVKDNIVYYYLVDVKDNSNIKFCYEDKISNHIDLVEIDDANLIKSLFISFANSIKNEL